MKHRMDERMIRELEQYALAYSCERCGLFDDRDQSCAFGFPTEPHRERPLRVGDELVFCKTFELAG